MSSSSSSSSSSRSVLKPPTSKKQPIPSPSTTLQSAEEEKELNELFERKRNAKIQRQQLKQMAVSYAFTMWLVIVLFLIVFILFFIFAVIINAFLLGLVSGGFWVTLYINENGKVCIDAADFGDIHDIKKCVSI